MIYATYRSPWVTLAGGISWLALILLHECGHMVAAHRMRSKVLNIELYPIHGLCRFEQPWSRFNHCVIAWGGVIAQAVVAIPVLLWLEVFGYTRFPAVNAVLGILGPYSLAITLFNLIPAGRLDGVMAWKIIPEFVHRVKARKNKKAKAASSGWRTH
jgi:membrane-associated protease RseP (regulator of RpoE activity)